MSEPPISIMEIELKVNFILETGEGDPEEAHESEDDLLWAFVRAEGARGNPDARALLRLETDAPDRTRWYA